MKFPQTIIPITEIPLNNEVQLFIKREDLVHPKISGNKFWKLYGQINAYIEKRIEKPILITFGGAFSNHIAAVAALGGTLQWPTLGIIRGDELLNRWQNNPTLFQAHLNGMDFRFLSRNAYTDKEILTSELQEEFPNALIIPEGGTNRSAVESVRNMLNHDTKSFNYLCTAVGTGGTVAGIAKHAGDHQRVLGFTVVQDSTLTQKIAALAERNNFELLESHFGGYGKITDENIRFINDFKGRFNIPLDPVYTGKMMQTLFTMIDSHYFPAGSKILAFHTGGLQGIDGANKFLKKKNRELIR